MKNILSFLGIDAKSRFSFMSWIGGVFIISYIIVLFYDVAQINYFFAKNKITIEVYERLIVSLVKDLLGIVTIIVLFFFKNNNQKDEINEP